MRKPGNQEEEFIHGFMDSLSACWRRCASSFIEVGGDVRRLTIFDLRYTIYARRRNRGRLVNRKSKIVNSVRAFSRRLLPDAGRDASSQCRVRSIVPASVRLGLSGCVTICAGGKKGCPATRGGWWRGW